MTENDSLSSYARNYTSQCGEDGIIEEIFKRIGIKHKICVEFGAWDGNYLSSTWNLWAKCGWESILIEGNPNKFNELLLTTKDFPNVKAINKWVDFEGKNSLEAILKEKEVPIDFDLLSIDIDGDDYYIFKSLEYFEPRLVVIEFNHTIPLSIDIVQKPSEYFGASAMAICNLAKTKGYSPCCMTDGNIFLLKDSQFEKLEINKPEISELFTETHLTYIISAYDGRLYLSKKPTFVNELNKKPVRISKEKSIIRLGKYSLNIKIMGPVLKSPVINDDPESLLPIEVLKS